MDPLLLPDCQEWFWGPCPFRIIIDSSVRRVLGRETLASILTGERETINGSIRDEVNQSVKSLGIEIIDASAPRRLSGSHEPKHF